ncbi:hypothetical protein K456DRAFT_1756602 [Colletotrichum gloeosporioides 23]|nr:hypothetical protein K456DRAFT_1756602 [Colletotrichum gloeosporioides 23]
MAGCTPSATSSLRCTKVECSSTFSTKSNLNRHLRSKHGPKAHAACGKEFPNQPWNIKRHMKACGECKRKMDDKSSSPEKRQNNADNLNLYAFPFEYEAAGQHDSISGDIGSFDTISWGYEEYPFGLEHE